VNEPTALFEVSVKAALFEVIRDRQVDFGSADLGPDLLNSEFLRFLNCGEHLSEFAGGVTS
jgi:hypothetical protein